MYFDNIWHVLGGIFRRFSVCVALTYSGPAWMLNSENLHQLGASWRENRMSHDQTCFLLRAVVHWYYNLDFYNVFSASFLFLFPLCYFIFFLCIYCTYSPYSIFFYHALWNSLMCESSGNLSDLLQGISFVFPSVTYTNTLNCSDNLQSKEHVTLKHL